MVNWDHNLAKFISQFVPNDYSSFESDKPAQTSDCDLIILFEKALSCHSETFHIVMLDLNSLAGVELFSSDLVISDCSHVYLHQASSHLYTFQSHSNDSFGELHSSPVVKRWGNDSRQSPILLFSPQLGPGDAGLDETFWLQNNSLQLLSQEHQRSVISLRGRLRCWRSVCSLAVIRDSVSYHWNQGSEMRWGDCWSQNASARSTKGNFTKWNRVAGFSVE